MLYFEPVHQPIPQPLKDAELDRMAAKFAKLPSITPGDWHLNDRFPYQNCICAPDGTVIATMGSVNAQANARLIVAAPKLLVTLEKLTAQVAMQVLKGKLNRNLDANTLESTCALIAEIRGIK